jgi:hypothetical protein
MGEKKPIHKSEKKPTMKRRMDEHDYTERCIYMITLAVEGREPVLGTQPGGGVGGCFAADINNKNH